MIKNNLKYYRTERGLTQTQLANLVGCSKNTISSIECGTGFTAFLALKLCIVLNIKFEDLCYVEKEK